VNYQLMHCSHGPKGRLVVIRDRRATGPWLQRLFVCLSRLLGGNLA
jgi:hypothetical protein